MAEQEDKIKFDLKDYRAPVVTSIGLIGGFLLGTLGTWVSMDDFNLNELRDKIAFFGMMIAIIILMLTLYQVLQPYTTTQQSLKAYRRIIRFLFAGIFIALFSLLIPAFML